MVEELRPIPALGSLAGDLHLTRTESFSPRQSGGGQFADNKKKEPRWSLSIMKTTKFVVVALVLLSSFPMLARQTGTLLRQNSSATAAGRHVSGNNFGPGANGALGMTGNAAAQTGGNLRGAASNSNAAAGRLLAARPTGIPGVMLASDATGSAYGVLSASRRNVHLDSGTQMMLGISSALAR